MKKIVKGNDFTLKIPVMIGREIYQYKHYKLERFEWEDVVRYSLIIILGSVVNYFIFW